MTQLAAQAADVTVVTPIDLTYRLGTPLDSVPARRALAVGPNVVDLADALVLSSQRENKPRRVEWRVVIREGVAGTLHPLDEVDLAETAALDLVRGLEQVEQEPVLDSAWDVTSAKLARRLTQDLGATDATGLTLSVGGRPEVQHSATVTRAAAEHLGRAIRPTVTSYGTVTGFLGRIRAGRRRSASLWSDLDGRRVTVNFQTDQLEQVRAAWAEPHVEITGFLHENAAGQALRIDMERLRVISTEGRPTWADLPAGCYPEMTGGLSTLAYLDMIRGTT